MNDSGAQRYISFLKLTLAAVCFLILVGGVVRATGSGLGCPDWPKCFGQWIPPTDVSELPADYKEVFKVAGKQIADFDAFKTWTEYLNRLLGAVIGMMIIGVVICSYAFKGQKSGLILYSWAALFLVSFQGWVGAVVVQTHLAAYMITIHMFLALCLVYLLLWLLRVAQERTYGKGLKWENLWRTKSLILVLFILSLLQVLLGTQVREAIDFVVKTYPDVLRGDWVERSGMTFLIHRSFSLVLLVTQALLCLRLFRLNYDRDAHFQGGLLLLCIASGIGLAYWDFPAWLQPVHLVIALVLNAAHFDLYLRKYLASHDMN